MHNLSVACVLDEDIYHNVRALKKKCTRSEYDVSVVQALRQLYRSVSLIAASDRIEKTIDRLTRLRPDVVFNLAFSSSPQEASFAGLLDMLGLAYTGSGPGGIALSNNKTRSRHLLRAAGVRVPDFVELVEGRKAAIGLKPPLLVKPVSLASSTGIYDDSVVKTKKKALGLAERIWRRFGTAALCDEFIVGREFRISLIEDKPGSFRKGGIIEWRFGAAPSGWGFRTEAMRANQRILESRRVTRDTAVFSRRKASELTDMGRAAVAALDIRGYATLDVRMDEQETFHVIEVNSNPGLWSGSKLWTAPSFARTIQQIVDSAQWRVASG